MTRVSVDGLRGRSRTEGAIVVVQWRELDALLETADAARELHDQQRGSILGSRLGQALSRLDFGCERCENTRFDGAGEPCAVCQ